MDESTAETDERTAVVFAGGNKFEAEPEAKSRFMATGPELGCLGAVDSGSESYSVRSMVTLYL